MEFYNGINPDVQQVLDLICAPMYSKIGVTAIEMEIFTLLCEPKTAEELAEKQAWHAANTALFLDAVASLRLLKKERGIYRNTAVADRYLVRGRPDFIGDYVVEFYRVNLHKDVDLAELVRNGPGNEVPATMDNVSFEAMADMMRKMQMGGRSAEIVDMLRGLPEYTDAKKLLDLGCGTGIIGIAAVQAHPTLRGILYDVPNMGDAVRESVRLQKTEDRAEFMGGNYLTDETGSGYDIVLAVGTLNFAKHALVPLMEKVHAALNEGGVMMCMGDGVHSEMDHQVSELPDIPQSGFPPLICVFPKIPPYPEDYLEVEVADAFASPNAESKDALLSDKAKRRFCIYRQIDGSNRPLCKRHLALFLRLTLACG